MGDGWHFWTGRKQEADGLVLTYHYSSRVPASVQLVGSLHESGGLFGDCGPMVAACYFSIPPTRWSESVLELTRLVRREDIKPPLTKLIALCCNELKKKGHDLLVSFADSTQGHHGGVYRAASWNYSGMNNPRNDGILIDGVFIPGRTCNAKFGTQSPSKLLEMGIDCVPHFDTGKHLYWRALNKSGKRKAERLGLKKLDYECAIDGNVETAYF
jgi:hypothetical protein